MTIPEAFEYQLEGIEFIKRNRACYLQDEQGLGKSRQTIDGLADIRQVFSVHPVSVIYSMEREVEKWQPGNWPVEIWRTRKDIRELEPDEKVWVIMPWSSMSNLLAKDKRTLLRNIPGAVWLDEAHYAKSWTAQRTGNALDLATRAGKVVLTSGTPMPNDASELGPILNAFWPEDLGGARNHHQWMLKSCMTRQRVFNGRMTWQIVQSKPSVLLKLKKTHQERGDWLRRAKVDVLTQLPERTWKQVPMLASPDVMATFNKILVDAGVDPSDSKAAWATLRRALGMAKVKFAADYVRELQEQGADKVLVFCHHQDVLHDLVRAFDMRSQDILTLYGATPDKHRQMFERRWNFPGGPTLAVCQMDAAGTGLTLHADGQCCNSVFVETTTVPGTLAQAADRTHRIGQPNPVTNHLLSVRHTIDDQIMRRVLTKLDDIQTLMGDRSVEI